MICSDGMQYTGRVLAARDLVRPKPKPHKFREAHQMLSVEDNEALTHVGPGTVMGDLLRQYWVPALLSEEATARRIPRQCACACWAKT